MHLPLKDLTDIVNILRLILVIALPCPSLRHSVLNFAQIVKFVKLATLFFLSCDMDLSKMIHGFVKGVPCISCPLLNKTKLKFDQDIKAC